MPAVQSLGKPFHKQMRSPRCVKPRSDNSNSIATRSNAKSSKSGHVALLTGGKNPGCAEFRASKAKSTQLQPCSSKKKPRLQTPKTDGNKSSFVTPAAGSTDPNQTVLRSNRVKSGCAQSSVDTGKPILT